jgi:hypothetical protein
MSVCLAKDDVDNRLQELSSVAHIWPRHGDALHARDSLRGSPVTNDSEADGLPISFGKEISIPLVAERLAVPAFIPAANQSFITF